MITIKTILITGANGFTGVHACQYFSALNLRVVAIVRKQMLNPQNCRAFSAELTDFSAVENIIKTSTPDFILHLAGMNSVSESWKDPHKALMSNVVSTLHLLEAARVHSPSSRILIVGSLLEPSAASPLEGYHPYGISKSLQSLLVLHWQKLFQQEIMVVKPCNLIGPGHSNGVISTFAELIAKTENQSELNKEIHVTNLRNKREFIDVRDAVIAYKSILFNGDPGKTYQIGSGKLNSLKEILTILQNKTTAKLKIIDQKLHPSDSILADLTNIKPLGWHPEFSLDHSIEDILAFYRNSHLFPFIQKNLDNRRL